mgnify:CR=1 FL=1
MKVDEILLMMALLDSVLITESDSGCTLYYGTVEEVPCTIRDIEALTICVYDDETLQIHV